MAGHSKWSNIKHKKKKKDKKRAKLFSKLSKNIRVAAKKNPDPEQNPELRSAIEQAHENDMPKENIKRAIDRATGVSKDGEIEKIEYGVLGPENTPIIVTAMTDNRNRTIGNLREVLNKNGGELTGLKSVNWQFDKVGIIEIKETEKVDELNLIDLGAENIKKENGLIKLITKPKELGAISKKIKDKYEIEDSYLGWTPKTEQKPSSKLLEIIGKIKDDPDIERVYPDFKQKT